MKYYFCICVLLGLSILFGSIQADLPSGSYKNSCHNCRVINNILSCLCPYSEQFEDNETYLALASGTGDIANCVGVLKYGKCEGDLAWKPDGSYQKSCKDCVVVTVPGSKQQALWCSCLPYPSSILSSTHYIKSGLILNENTTEDIASCSGSLVYGSCNGVMPGGSYQASCNPLLLDNLHGYSCFMKSSINPTDDETRTSWKQAYSLHCNCKNRAGNWIDTSLDVNLKSGEQVNNCNGQLKINC